MRIYAVVNAVLVLKHLPKKSLEVFLWLLQVKYGILTLLKRLLDSVVVRTCVSLIIAYGFNSLRLQWRVMRLGIFAAISFVSFTSEPCIRFGQRCHPAR